MDVDGIPVGIDMHSFAFRIADITRVEAQGPVFGLDHSANSELRIG
jgi:hypothetical protein